MWVIWKLKNEFSLVCPKIGGFAGDRLVIGRSECGPGGPLMLSSKGLSRGGPKLNLFFSFIV